MYTVATFLLVLGIMSCESETNTPSSKEVKAISKKVADWQIATFEDMGKYRALPVEKERKKWHNREKHHDLDWTCAALYAGMFEWSEITGDPKYSKWLYNIGVKNKWKLYKRMFHADDHADDIRDVVLDSFEIDDHFDITNYRDEIEEIAKEGLGDVEDNVKAALNDLIDSGKLSLTLSNY